MGLHEELDPQPEPTGCQIIHLLADAVPQIQPQVFSFAACELQPKVVYFDYAQLSANLKKGKTSGGGGHKKQTKWGVKLFTTGQWQMVKSSFKEAIDNFSCHVESDENQLSKVPLDFFFFFLNKEIHQYCCYCRYANTQTPINILKLTKWTWSPSRGTGAHQARNPTLLRRQQPWVYYITAAESLHREPGGWDKTRSVHIK